METDSHNLKAHEQKSDGERLESFKAKRIQASYYILSISLGTVLSALLIGYLLDGYFGTKPWIMLVLVLVSFPLNIYALYQFLNKKFK